MGKIQELPKSSSRLLTSTQIITSVYGVVKELIENALDSGAKNVEVKLEDYGLDKIEVKDNGRGIDKNDIPYVAKSHCTSKISSYSDLEKIYTYGFRGEALGAICAVADLIITTKSSEESIGSVSNFGHDGQVILTKPCSSVQGTTVSVQNLFKNIPVRKQFYRSEKNKKGELRKVEDLLLAYSCIQYDTRFALYHNRNLIWQKSAVSSQKDALIIVLGNSIMDNMKTVDYFDEQTQRKIYLYLPKIDAPSSCGFSNPSRCLTAVNKRPVRIKAIDKLLKEYYNKSIQNLGKARYPICFISFTLPLVEVDVNVEPNKTSVMLHHSDEILTQFSELLKSFYSSDTVMGKNLNVNNIPNENPLINKKEPSNASDFLTTLKNNCELKTQQSKLTFVNDCVKFASQIDNAIEKKGTTKMTSNPMQKEDIIKIDGLNEPRKKKLKTNFKVSSNDINNHIASLKDFFANEDQINNSQNKNLPVSVPHMPKVTVQRNASIKSGENISEVNESLSKVCNIQSNRISTFAVSTNLSSGSTDNSSPPLQNKNILNTSLQFQKDSDCSGENNFEINKSLSSVNNPCSDKIVLPINANSKTDKDNPSVPFEGRHTSNSSALPEKSNKSTVSNSEQNGDLWSRGIHPSGETIQPVAILQPKPISTSESNQKQTSNAENCNKKSPIDQKNLSFERKLTAFDIFCRNNRLEVAAQNPEFSNHQIAQILSEKWNRLSPEEKAVYKNMLNKDYRKDIKKKERLGRTVSQNLSQHKRDIPVPKKPKPKQFRPKSKNKNIEINIEEIRNSFLNKNSYKQPTEDLNIINFLAPGIWICAKTDKLILLNTFRLQETIIYHRLLETFQFDTETLDVPVYIPASHLDDDAMSVLIDLENNNDGSYSKFLIANGFDVRLIQDDNNETAVELVGITKTIAFYGIADLKDILLLIKENGYSAKLSECRPGKVILYLQSEANRMCRRCPPSQRIQDVKDLLVQKEDLLPNCNVCIHHKPFFHEVRHLTRSELE